MSPPKPTLKVARPIPLDVPGIKRFVADELVPAVVRWLERQPEEPLGDVPQGRVTSETIEVAVTGPRDPILVNVLVGAEDSGGKFEAVVKAGYGRRGPVHVVALFLNGALTPAELLSDKRMRPVGSCTGRTCLPYSLYSDLLHELTHAADQYKKQTQYDPKTVLQETSPSQYVNDPSEVRAFMQQVVDEVLQYMRSLPPSLKDPKRRLQMALKLSATWNLIRADLSPQNERIILKAVYQAVDDAGHFSVAAEVASAWRGRTPF